VEAVDSASAHVPHLCPEHDARGIPLDPGNVPASEAAAVEEELDAADAETLRYG
jgi:hypothetical protein